MKVTGLENLTNSSNDSDQINFLSSIQNKLKLVLYKNSFLKKN